MATNARQLKTSGLRLSELRPCDNCGGPLAPQFYVVDVTPALFGRGARETLALTDYLGGLARPGALRIAEALGPSADEVVIIGDELRTRLFICRHCHLGIDDQGQLRRCAGLAVLVEKASVKKAEADDGD